MISTHTEERPDQIELSSAGIAWLRKTARARFGGLGLFYEAVAGSKSLGITPKSAERTLQRAFKNRRLPALYLPALADALDAEDEGELSRKLSADNRLPEQSLQLGVSLLAKLRTYQIAIGVDLEKDELRLVYAAAYRMAQEIRALLEKFPAHELREFSLSGELFDLACRVLNEGLRPHLKLWRSLFEQWRATAPKLPAQSGSSEQQLQQEYPRIEELKADLDATTRRLLRERRELERLLSINLPGHKKKALDEITR